MFGGTGFDIVIVAEDCGRSHVQRVERRLHVQWRRSSLDADHTLPPQFLRHHQMVSVTEGQPARTFVTALEIIERPTAAAALLGDSRQLRIVAGNEDANFDLDATGALRTTRPLDAEAKSHYELRVRIGDQTTPASEARITIRVRNVPDRRPTLISLDIQKISEDAPIGLVVSRARVEHSDVESDVEYSLASPSTHFHVQRFTGDIVLVAPLDAETRAEHTLHVQVRDGSEHASLDNMSDHEEVSLKQIYDSTLTLCL